MILDVAAGVVVGYILLALLKRPIDVILKWLWNVEPVFAPQPRERSHTRLLSTVKGGNQMYDPQDWIDLWVALPDAAKNECRRILDDDDLRRRVQQSDEDLGLWPYLWSFASDDTKALIQNRWLEPQKKSAVARR